MDAGGRTSDLQRQGWWRQRGQKASSQGPALAPRAPTMAPTIAPPTASPTISFVHPPRKRTPNPNTIIFMNVERGDGMKVQPESLRLRSSEVTWTFARPWVSFMT